MSNSKDEILVREISKLGGSVGGAGGALGSVFAARRLPSHAHKLSIEIHAPPRDITKTVFRILSEQGELIDDVGPPSNLPTICAAVGSGFLSMNPTVVQVEVMPTSESSALVSVIATAKEGLIKQKSGEKAAKRIAALLSETYPQS